MLANARNIERQTHLTNLLKYPHSQLRGNIALCDQFIKRIRKGCPNTVWSDKKQLVPRQ